jgi:hypothetical protein
VDINPLAFSNSSFFDLHTLRRQSIYPFFSRRIFLQEIFKTSITFNCFEHSKLVSAFTFDLTHPHLNKFPTNPNILNLNLNRKDGDRMGLLPHQTSKRLQPTHGTDPFTCSSLLYGYLTLTLVLRCSSKGSCWIIQASAVQASLQRYRLHFGNPEISPFRLHFQPYRLHNRGFH